MDINELKLKAAKWDNYQRSISELKESKHKAVKKTLTIPKWLDELAIENDINFSHTLQKALKEILHIDND